MQAEDAVHLLDGRRILVGAVAGGDDQLALRALHVAAPVRDDAVRLDARSVIEVAAFAPVTNLLALREFIGMERDTTTNSLALINHCLLYTSDAADE